MSRVLVSGIKFLGEFLCPLCLTNKKHVNELGTKRDRQRHEKQQVDTEHRQSMVDTAREWIFERGYHVNGNALKRFLTYSITPIRMRKILFLIIYYLQIVRMLFHLFSFRLVSIFIRCLWLIQCMTLSWESGRMSLHIF